MFSNPYCLLYRQHIALHIYIIMTPVIFFQSVGYLYRPERTGVGVEPTEIGAIVAP